MSKTLTKKIFGLYVKEISKSIFVVFALFMIGCSSGRVTPSLNPGDSAPFTRFTLLSGEPVTLEQFRGKPTVIIFWASTCTFSPKVVERLNRMVGKIGTHRATFIAASLDKADILSEIKEMIRLRDMNNFTHAMSGNAEYDEAYLALRGSELPYIVIVGADGKIVSTGTSVSAVEKYFAS